MDGKTEMQFMIKQLSMNPLTVEPSVIRPSAKNIHKVNKLQIFSQFYSMRSAINTLGPTYNEFVYNQHPVTRSRFLCIKIIECDVENFDYNEHPLKRPVSFAYLLPTNEVWRRLFSQVSVCPRGREWQGGGHGRGGGMHGTHTSPQQILRDTVNERAVHILLECILVLLVASGAQCNSYMNQYFQDTCNSCPFPYLNLFLTVALQSHIEQVLFCEFFCLF